MKMKHESIRNKENHCNKRLLHNKKSWKSRQAYKFFGRRKVSSKDGYVSLLSEHFIRSINAAIWKAEQTDCEIFWSAKSINSSQVHLIENYINQVDLPGWDDIDIDLSNAEEDLQLKVNQIALRDDIILDSGAFTIKCLMSQEDFGYYEFDLSTIDYCYENNYGLIAVLLMVYLRTNRQLPGYGGYDAEYYSGWFDEVDDSEERIQNISTIRKIIMAEKRLDDFLSYMHTKIDLSKIGEIIERYAKRYDSEKLHNIAEAISHLQLWTNRWDNEIEPIVQEYNIFEMIVWFGSEEQTNNFLSDYNENYGSGEGTYIRFNNQDRQTILNQEALDYFEEQSLNPPPQNLIGSYGNILNELCNESNIKEYKRLSSSSDINADIYRELVRQSGCSKSAGSRWKSPAFCTSFTQVLKETRRLCASESGSKSL